MNVKYFYVEELVMETLGKFKRVFREYKYGEERMGNGIRFVYDSDDGKVSVYTEEWDAYDGYDDFGSPYYFSLFQTWEGVSLMEFAKVMEHYLDYRENYDYDKIYCYFKIE